MRQFSLAYLAAFAALAITGCSRDTPEPATGDTSTDAAVATSEGMATPTPTPSASSSAAVMAIPQAVQGRWGLVPADCTSTRGDAKGLLVIDARTLKFYESVATLEAVHSAAANAISAAFAFTGEGQSWVLDVTLEVQDDAKTLIRHDSGPDAASEPLKYTRC